MYLRTPIVPNRHQPERGDASIKIAALKLNRRRTANWQAYLPHRRDADGTSQLQRSTRSFDYSGYAFAQDLCPKDAVAGIAQAWEDVPFGIQLAVDGGAVNRNFRMLLMQCLDAFRRCDQADKFHAGDIGFFQE